MINYLPSEISILLLAPVKLLIYKWITGSFYWTKIVEVTNKRILISFQWFGFESRSSALSCYYKLAEYKKHKKFGDSYIINYEVSKGIFGERIKIVAKQGFMTYNMKIYTEKSKEIRRIIRENS